MSYFPTLYVQPLLNVTQLFNFEHTVTNMNFKNEFIQTLYFYFIHIEKILPKDSTLIIHLTRYT